MTKIEIEIDDALLARVQATGRTVQDIGAEGFALAVQAREGEQAMDDWIRAQQIADRARDKEWQDWLATKRPDIWASFEALKSEWGDRMEPERSASIVLTEKQAATFAWLEIVTAAWEKTKPFDQLRIDLDDPRHWQAAQDYARRGLYQHYKKEWSALEWGTHPLLTVTDENEEIKPG